MGILINNKLKEIKRMRKIDLSKVENLSNGNKFQQLPAGGYICAIKKVVDHPNEEYLEVQYDVAKGEHKGYFTKFEKEMGWARNTFRVYYREGKSQSFFKSFITSIEESNKNFKFDGVDEESLEKKYIGLVIGIREYQGNDGRIKTSEEVRLYRSVKAIEDGDFTMPELKKLDDNVRVNKSGKAKEQEQDFEDIFGSSDNDSKPDSSDDEDDDLPF